MVGLSVGEQLGGLILAGHRGQPKAVSKVTKRGALPADWTWRDCVVKGWAVSLKVPSHIVRIDIDEAGSAGTHGWQVRYRTDVHGTKLFSDAKFDTSKRMAAPEVSLGAAMAYLASIWVGKIGPRLGTRRDASKQHPTGMPGVRVAIKPTRASFYYSVRVDRLDGTPICSLYAGTEFSATEESLQACIKEGRRVRYQYLCEIGAETRLDPELLMELQAEFG